MTYARTARGAGNAHPSNRIFMEIFAPPQSVRPAKSLADARDSTATAFGAAWGGFAILVFISDFSRGPMTKRCLTAAAVAGGLLYKAAL